MSTASASLALPVAASPDDPRAEKDDAELYGDKDLAVFGEGAREGEVALNVVLTLLHLNGETEHVCTKI
jgi:hypothetical protein